MNDKCAGGTGAVIDKINAKLQIPPDQLCDMGYDGIKLHPVAGKCGVFAETDINSLQKMGVPPDQLMASLFDAIVGQNISVLTRGNTLRPHVLLLGGPNTFIRGMVEAWRHAIPLIWKERKTLLPEGRPHGADPRPESASTSPRSGPCSSALRGGGRRRLPRHREPAPLHRRRADRGEAGRRRQGPGGGPGRARGLQGALPPARVRRGVFTPARRWRGSSA